jgi:hypothetical protein
VPVDSSFLVEDFINAITSQLDRVQDALRIKAVNRPLTYALRDLTLELKVFVDMDNQGNVRFRTSGPNEAGASVVHLGFTTITKPMIEENTISLAATRSASLDELGLSREEKQKLELLGVRNLNQLQNLGASTGINTVARLADLSIDRIKQALVLGKPRVTTVQPEPVPPKPVPPPRPLPPKFSTPVTRPPVIKLQPEPAKPTPSPIVPGVLQPPIRLAPGTSRLNLFGANLIGENGPSAVRLNGQELAIAEADSDKLVVEIPSDAASGQLEVHLPDGNALTYQLSVEGVGGSGNGHEEWSPDGDLV